MHIVWIFGISEVLRLCGNSNFFVVYFFLLVWYFDRKLCIVKNQHMAGRHDMSFSGCFHLENFFSYRSYQSFAVLEWDFEKYWFCQGHYCCSFLDEFCLADNTSIILSQKYFCLWLFQEIHILKCKLYELLFICSYNAWSSSSSIVFYDLSTLTFPLGMPPWFTLYCS